MASDKRDPRVDPRPGDITRGKYGIEYQCIQRSSRLAWPQFVWYRSRNPGGEWDDGARWHLADWQHTAAGDQVVHVAEVDEPPTVG